MRSTMTSSPRTVRNSSSSPRHRPLARLGRLADRAVVLDQQVAAVVLAGGGLGHVALDRAHVGQGLHPVGDRGRRPGRAARPGTTAIWALVRALDHGIDAALAQRLPDRLEQADGEVGVAVGEQRRGQRGQLPQLGRAGPARPEWPRPPRPGRCGPGPRGAGARRWRSARSRPPARSRSPQSTRLSRSSSRRLAPLTAAAVDDGASSAAGMAPMLARSFPKVKGWLNHAAAGYRAADDWHDEAVATRILAVEDDERIRTGLRMALEDEGWAVEEAENGEDALQLFRRDPADVVLIDIMLPGVDGFEVCRSLRRASDVPIIMVTARADTHDVVAGLEAGADDYLTKPFAPKELSARIRALLRRARAPEPGITHLRFGDLEIVPDAGVVTLAGTRGPPDQDRVPPAVRAGLEPGPGLQPRGAARAGLGLRLLRRRPAGRRPHPAAAHQDRDRRGQPSARAHRAGARLQAAAVGGGRPMART